MSKKLTKEQIDELFEFCYLQSVIHYDMQVELVDHLASDIEQKWETNPGLSFDDALYHVSEQFGGHKGFVIIREEKEKALRKKYRRLLWQFVLDYYKFPKIMITATLALLLFTAFRFAENDQWVIAPLVVSLFCFALFYMLYFSPKFVRLRVKEGHAFLLNEIARKGVLSKTMIGFGGVMIQYTKHEYQFSLAWSIILSVLISLYAVLLYADCFFIPKKIHRHFSEQFPEFAIL